MTVRGCTSGSGSSEKEVHADSVVDSTEGVLLRLLVKSIKIRSGLVAAVAAAAAAAEASCDAMVLVFVLLCCCSVPFFRDVWK